MYSGGFYPFDTLEEQWAYWSRYIYINRYMDALKPVYRELYDLVKDKDYFVLTTNVDHCFQKRDLIAPPVLYARGLWLVINVVSPAIRKTYDNGKIIRKMIEAQGYVIAENGEINLPEGIAPKMKVPSELVPYCPQCENL